MSSHLKSFDFPPVNAEEAEKRARQKRASSSKGEDPQKRSRSPSSEQPVCSTLKKSKDGVIDVEAVGSVPPKILDLSFQQVEPTQTPVTPYIPASVCGANHGESSLGEQILDLDGAAFASAPVEVLTELFDKRCRELQHLSLLLSAKVAEGKEVSAELRAARQAVASAKEEVVEWKAKFNAEKAEREKYERICNEISTSLRLLKGGV